MIPVHNSSRRVYAALRGSSPTHPCESCQHPSPMELVRSLRSGSLKRKRPQLVVTGEGGSSTSAVNLLGSGSGSGALRSGNLRRKRPQLVVTSEAVSSTSAVNLLNSGSGALYSGKLHRKHPQLVVSSEEGLSANLLNGDCDAGLRLPPTTSYAAYKGNLAATSCTDLGFSTPTTVSLIHVPTSGSGEDRWLAMQVINAMSRSSIIVIDVDIDLDIINYGLT